MASKSSIRVQVSLRRVVDVTEERSSYEHEAQENDKSNIQKNKSATSQRSR